MPEIPEVRAHAQRLNNALAGLKLESARALSVSGIKSVRPPITDAVDLELSKVTSFAKIFVFDFGPSQHFVHLMQGGRLRIKEKPPKRSKSTIFAWNFGEGMHLLLTEAGKQHSAGVWTGSPGHPPDIVSRLGPEADSLDTDSLHQVLRSANGRIHKVLRNQRHLSGVGRRLANEICYSAGLSPFAISSKLDSDQIESLHAAIGKCIEESESFENQQTEMVSSKHRPATVHNKTGHPCPKCSASIAEVSYNAYTINYCPGCQTDGRVLSDNTTSKFLK